jgi:hypothetical protein
MSFAIAFHFPLRIRHRGPLRKPHVFFGSEAVFQQHTPVRFPRCSFRKSGVDSDVSDPNVQAVFGRELFDDTNLLLPERLLGRANA